MGQAAASSPLRLIVANTITAFNIALRGKGSYKIYGSNLGLWLKETDSHYKPDVTVLAEEPCYEFHKVKKRTVRSIVNPFAVVEVLSEGTKRYDFEQKKGHYKKCPSVQYVLLVSQKQPLVMLYRRTERPGEWISTDAEGMGDSFLLAGHPVALADIFEGVDFGAKEPGAAK